MCARAFCISAPTDVQFQDEKLLALNHHIVSREQVPIFGRPRMTYVVTGLVTVIMLLVLRGHGIAESRLPFFTGLSGMTDHFGKQSERSSLLEARVGYLWGTNAIRFRDGDNDNSPAGKKEVSLESPLFGVHGGTRLKDDLAVRVQAWINLPQKTRGDFYLDRSSAGTLTSRAWETGSRYLAADIGLIYHLGPFGSHINYLGTVGMPYTAGLVAGYRYTNFDYTSTRSAPPTGTFHDHFHIHIPYLGVHYAHEKFVGSLVRLDVLASPLTLSRLDAERHLTGVITQIEGESVTGFWFESLFSWSWPVSDGVFLGMTATYNYLELSGSAAVDRAEAGVLNATRFSLDSITHLISIGVTGVVTF